MSKATEYTGITHFRKYNWEVIEQETPWDLQTKVYLVDRSQEPSMARIVKDGYMELEKIKEGSEMSPTFSLPTDVWKAIKESMIAQSPKQPDIETFSELKATKYHLEDMRKLALGKK